MVINNVYIDIKNDLIVCSTDAGITLYSLTSLELGKIREYKIIEGCRLCRLIKTNSKNASNIMSAVYLPKSKDTTFCILDLTLPTYINNNNNNQTQQDDFNDNVGSNDYQNDTPVTKNYVTGRFDLGRTIYNIHLTTDKIIIVHDREIFVIGKTSYSTINIISTHLNTTNGLALVSSKEDYLIYTLGTRCGEVVKVTPNTNDHTSFKCHDHEIQCIATDDNENYLATASVSGTIIKVYDLVSGNEIFAFRRGTTSATIWDIAISEDLKWLACCSYSTRGTVHIFKLDATNNKVENGKTFFNRMFEDYTTAYFSKDSIVNATWSAVQHNLNSTIYHTCRFDKAGNLHIVSLDGKHFKVLANYDYKRMTEGKNLCVVG